MSFSFLAAGSHAEEEEIEFETEPQFDILFFRTENAEGEGGSHFPRSLSAFTFRVHFPRSLSAFTFRVHFPRSLSAFKISISQFRCFPRRYQQKLHDQHGSRRCRPTGQRTSTRRVVHS